MGNESSSPSDEKFPKDHTFIKFNNLGNTCYVNSILQSFLNSKEIINYCNNVKKSIKTIELSEKVQDSLFMEFLEIINQITGSNKSQITYSPTAFINKVYKTFTFLEPKRQHDAHEFFVSLLDNFDDTITEMNKTRTEPFPPFSSILTVESTTRCQCQMCGHETILKEQSSSIYLSLKERSSLNHRLKALQSPEYFIGDGKRFCDTCQIKQEMIGLSTFDKLTPLVVFQLQRFEFDRATKSMTKLQGHVPFPSSIVITEKQYFLKTVVVHIGSSLSRGHFVAVLRIGERWFLSSDSSLTPLGENEVQEFFLFGRGNGPLPAAYLLFYEQKNK